MIFKGLVCSSKCRIVSNRATSSFGMCRVSSWVRWGPMSRRGLCGSSCRLSLSLLDRDDWWIEFRAFVSTWAWVIMSGKGCLDTVPCWGINCFDVVRYFLLQSYLLNLNYLANSILLHTFLITEFSYNLLIIFILTWTQDLNIKHLANTIVSK